MKTYRLKLTTLSPIHIGTGEVYEPTNFIIDDGYLHEFDEFLFVKSLNNLDLQSFNAKLDNYIQIIDFYKKPEIKNQAKVISHTKIPVTKKVESRYNTINNKDGSKTKNLFEIQKTYKNPNSHRAVIPGSSIKGMLDTVFGIYPKSDATNETRQKLVVSDSVLIEGGTKIGYCYRKHKNPDKKAKSEIPQTVEIISKNSTFLLSIKTELSFEEIIDKFEKYFFQQSRDNNMFKVTSNSFVSRIGKFSGKAFMVNDGRNVLNNDRKPVATHTLYEDDTQFGWINIEKISNEEFKKAQATIEEQEKEYFSKLDKRQKDIKDKILNIKEEKIALELKKREAEELRRKKEEEEKKKEQERLNSLNPFELKVEELKKEYHDQNASISVVIFQAIKENKIDEFKNEAISFVKEMMIKEGVWDKKKKKSAYKRTEVIKEMLGE